MANIVIPTQHLTGSATGSGTLNLGTRTITLNTKDKYVTEDIDVSVDASVTIQAGSFANQASSGVTYTDNTDPSTVIPAGGYLYINKGWYEPTKISLGQLIPDDTQYTNAGVAHIRTGYEAYSPTGAKLIGTMPDTTLSASGGAMSGTMSVTGNTINVTPSIGGTATDSTKGGKYGITATKPSGTDGSSYFTFDPDATGGSVNVPASITVTRADVDTSGIAGYYDGTTCTLASGTQSFSGTATVSTSTVNSANHNWYIPVVSPAGTGGTVTKSSGSGSVTGTSPNVSLTHSGKFTDTASNGVGTAYGVVEGTPPSGQTDGTNYLKITTAGTPGTAQTWSGTATISYTRAAITAAAAYKGAVNIASGASLLGQTTGSLTHEISGSVSATASGGKTYYIPIVTPAGTGGGVTKTTGSGSVTGTNPTVTISETGTFTASTTSTNYGVTTTQPSTGTDGTNYVTLVVGGTANTQTWSGTASIDYTRAAVTAASTYKGAVNIASGSSLLAQTTGTLTQTISGDVSASITGGTTYYVPIVSPTASTPSVSARAAGDTLAISGTAPAVTLSHTGSFTQVGSGETGNYYGVTSPASAPSGTDGTTYLSITTGGSSSTGSYSTSGKVGYTRGAIKGGGTYKGLCNISSSTTLRSSATGTLEPASVSTSVTATVSGNKSYYIPIVTPAGTGGGVSKSSGSGTITGNNPTVTLSHDGKFTDTGSGGVATNYGVVQGTPPSGQTDGTNYLKITTGGSSNSQTFSGTASITYARDAVVADADYIGATHIDTGYVFLSDTTGTLTQNMTNKTVSASVTGGKTYYIPIVTPAASGGGLTNSSTAITMSGGSSIAITPNVKVYTRTGTSTGTTETSGYGMQTSTPSSGTWLKFDPGATSGSNSTVNASITVTRAAVTVSCSPGATNGTGTGLSSTSATYNGSASVGTTINAGTDIYIPVKSVTASVNSHTVSSPTVTITSSANHIIGGSSVVTDPLPAGVLTTAPSDLATNTAGYLYFSGSSVTSTAGSSSTVAHAEIAAGITNGSSSNSSADTKPVTAAVTNNATAEYYVAVYDGSYTIS
jgi:hypothetical protein